MKIRRKELLIAPLLIYIAFCLYRQPNVADALIIISLVGFFGYQLHLEMQEKQNEKTQLVQAYDELVKKINEVNNTVQSLTLKTTSLEDDVGKVSLSLSKVAPTSKKTEKVYF